MKVPGYCTGADPGAVERFQTGSSSIKQHQPRAASIGNPLQGRGSRWFSARREDAFGRNFLPQQQLAAIIGKFGSIGAYF